VIGCLVVGILALILFANTPLLLWPVIVVVLIVLAVLAAVFGVLNGILDALFGRRR
jgi:uncharacterized membrane protein